jgi:hypothetical protein
MGPRRLFARLAACLLGLNQNRHLTILYIPAFGATQRPNALLGRRILARLPRNRRLEIIASAAIPASGPPRTSKDTRLREVKRTSWGLIGGATRPRGALYGESR